MESEISSSEVLSVRLLETLTLMTPISTESSASGWQRLAVVDLGLRFATRRRAVLGATFLD